MLSESRALCEKWGLAAGTLRFNECLADIQAVRDRQVERIRARRRAALTARFAAA